MVPSKAGKPGREREGEEGGEGGEEALISSLGQGWG